MANGYDSGTGYMKVTALADTTGVLNITPQASGIPLMPNGMSGPVQTANIRASEGAGTTTLVSTDSRRQIFTLTADRNCQLPTTGILAGDVWILENRGAFDLTVKSSDGTSITAANAGTGSVGDPTINLGTVYITALQAAPTATTHWLVEYVNEIKANSSTYTWDGSGGTSGTVNMTLYRVNKQVQLSSAAISATTGTSSTTLTSNTAVDSRFRPTAASPGIVVGLKQNATPISQAGLWYINTSGILKVQKTDASAFANANANTGAPNSMDTIVLPYRIA